MTHHELAKEALRRRWSELRDQLRDWQGDEAGREKAAAEMRALRHVMACVAVLENLVEEFEDTELKTPRRVSMDASKMVGFTEQAILLMEGGPPPQGS